MGGRAVQLAMSGGVLILGLYLALGQASGATGFGWVLAGLGALGLVAGLGLPSRPPPRR